MDWFHGMCTETYENDKIFGEALAIINFNQLHLEVSY